MLGPDRRCCVCRELTKVHEEFLRGTLAEALAEFSRREPRGEIVLLVEAPAEGGAAAAEGSRGRATEEEVSVWWLLLPGNAAARGRDGQHLAAQVLARMREMAAELGPKFRVNDASRLVADDCGWRKKEVYQLWLREV